MQGLIYGYIHLFAYTYKQLFMYPCLSHMPILMTGTEVLIDGLERSGSLIIGPSFVERRLRVKTKSSVSAHNLEVYRAGLVAIIDDAVYTKRVRERSRERDGRGRGSDVTLSSSALTPAPLLPPLPSPQPIDEGEKGVEEEVEDRIGDADLLPTVQTHDPAMGDSISDREDGSYRHAASGTVGARTYGYSSLIDLSGDDLAEHMHTSNPSHTSHPPSSSSSSTYNPLISNASGEDKTLSRCH